MKHTEQIGLGVEVTTSNQAREAKQGGSRRSRWLANSLLAGLLMLNAGCAAVLIGGGAAVGAGTVAYVRGELRATEEASLQKTWDASLAAMKDLEFKVITQDKDAVSGKLEARGAENKKVHVTLKKQTDKITEIHIRVGTFGDQALSRLVLDKIKKHV